MEYKIYICRKRAKFKAICGQVNIRYGTILNCQGGFLILNDLPVCSVTSQNAYDFFTQNDDGMGKERGELLNRITATLMKQTPGHNARWGKIWDDPRCQKYKRPEQEDHWIWNHDFYNGPIEDLRYPARSQCGQGCLWHPNRVQRDGSFGPVSYTHLTLPTTPYV